MLGLNIMIIIAHFGLCGLIVLFSFVSLAFFSGSISFRRRSISTGMLPRESSEHVPAAFDHGHPCEMLRHYPGVLCLIFFWLSLRYGGDAFLPGILQQDSPELYRDDVGEDANWSNGGDIGWSNGSRAMAKPHPNRPGLYLVYRWRERRLEHGYPEP